MVRLGLWVVLAIGAYGCATTQAPPIPKPILYRSPLPSLDNEPSIKTAAKAMNQMALELLKQGSNTNQNLLFSPLALQLALASLHQGIPPHDPARLSDFQTNRHEAHGFRQSLQLLANEVFLNAPPNHRYSIGHANNIIHIPNGFPFFAREPSSDHEYFTAILSKQEIEQRQATILDVLKLSTDPTQLPTFPRQPPIQGYSGKTFQASNQPPAFRFPFWIRIFPS